MFPPAPACAIGRQQSHTRTRCAAAADDTVGWRLTDAAAAAVILILPLLSLPSMMPTAPAA